MEAASELIWEYSYGAVTIDAICERAGVKKGSFYYFFESKSDLALVAIQKWWVARQAMIEEVFRPEVPPLERIHRYMDFIAERQIASFELTGQVLGCPLFGLGSEISNQDEPLRKLIQEILTRGALYFESAIRDAQRSGELPGTNATIKARQLLAYYEGTLTRARIQNDPELVRNLASESLELLGANPAQSPLVLASVS